MAKDNGKNLPAKVESRDMSVPDFLPQGMQGYEGAGVSTRAEDNLIPMVRILQDLSGEVKSRDPRFIEGSVVGDIYMSSIRKLWKGSEGYLFQPCGFKHGWVERKTRDAGGDFVAQYEEPPEDVVQVDKNKWMRGDNDFVETRYHFGFIHDDDGMMPAVMTMSSTGHTISKSWTTLMNTHKVGGLVAPCFARLYHVKTTLRKRNNNEWYLYDITNADWVRDKNQYEAGKALFDAVNAGDKKVDTSDLANDAGDSGDDKVPF